jgi:hypothetical protein
MAIERKRLERKHVTMRTVSKKKFILIGLLRREEVVENNDNYVDDHFNKVLYQAVHTFLYFQCSVISDMYLFLRHKLNLPENVMVKVSLRLIN